MLCLHVRIYMHKLLRWVDTLHEEHGGHLRPFRLTPFYHGCTTINADSTFGMCRQLQPTYVQHLNLNPVRLDKVSDHLSGVHNPETVCIIARAYKVLCTIYIVLLGMYTC